MRTRSFFAALFLFSVPVFAADSSPLFKQANEEYRKGDFKGAAATYQKLIQTGTPTAAAYYNLGNAALRSGEKGQALVHYERARRAAPRDADLLWNIRVLKGALPDKIEDRSHFAIAALRAFLSQWTADELALAFSLFLALAAFAGAAGFFLPRARLGWLRTPALAGVLVFGVLCGLKWLEIKDPRVVVLDKETNAHYGPSERETKAFVLHEGAEGKVIDESGDWIYVQLENGNTGWIRKNASETV